MVLWKSLDSVVTSTYMEYEPALKNIVISFLLNILNNPKTSITPNSKFYP